MGAKKSKPSPLGICIVALLLVCVMTSAQTSAAQKPILIQPAYVPQITSLSARIPIPDSVPPQTMWNYPLQEYNQDVEAAYKAIAQGNPAPLQFYRYTAQKGDTIITLAARFSIPQETLATANDIESADSGLLGKELIVPTAPGLFIARQPISSLEILVAQEQAAILTAEKATTLPHYRIGSKEYLFLQGAHLSGTGRAFFLDTTMRMPLTEYVISSDFGYRVSPISGTWKNHSGVDLAAPEGTPVYACKRGTVAYVFENDKTFGNYIILQHANAQTSVYAHLSSISVKKGDRVSTGKEIGKVGTTGASTGPHLHFEVRQNGSPVNPLQQ